jgi:hypothetical protein
MTMRIRNGAEIARRHNKQHVVLNNAAFCAFALVAYLLQLNQKLLRLLPPPLLYELVFLSAANASHTSCAVVVFVCSAQVCV